MNEYRHLVYFRPLKDLDPVWCVWIPFKRWLTRCVCRSKRTVTWFKSAARIL